MKQIIYSALILTLSMFSCTDSLSEEKILKETGQLQEVLTDEGYETSALEFNNKLMMSQNILHSKLQKFWNAETDSSRRKAFDDFKFELLIHESKVSELKYRRAKALEFAKAVTNYIHFLKEHEGDFNEFIRLAGKKLENLTVAESDKLDRLVQDIGYDYNQKMDSVSFYQMEFAKINKVQLN